MIACKTERIAGFDIKIEQHKNGLFRVTYGKQVEDNLTYFAAAQQYGLCVFHALAWEGRLSSEGRAMKEGV